MTTDGPALNEILIDHLYEIAEEPGSFDRFVNEWAEAAKVIDDHRLGRHLERAQAFLARLEPDELDHAAVLQRYARFAAFIVGSDGQVAIANAGATEAFGLRSGGPLSAASLSDEVLQRLQNILREAQTAREEHQLLLRMDFARQKGAILLRVQRLAQRSAILVVSTHFQWNHATDKILSDAYELTEAERHIVRLLVEGHDTKSVSALRQTTEGTTRGQIKSIIAKMNLRSQADVVRVTVMLGEMPGTDSEKLAIPAVQKNWLEQEVWKPFSVATLPDGRKQTFHDMGPKDGAPVLLSHLGSCMVRWPAPMLRLTYEHKLRVICPLRAGYGQSELPEGPYDPFALTTNDTVALLDRLEIAALPYVVQGSDFPLAAHFTHTQKSRVTELISLSGRPCLPDGTQPGGSGAWQKFFVNAARNAPKVTEFAAAAIMAMSRRIGPTAMLKSLCKDSAADLKLLTNAQMAEVLEANIALMSNKSSNTARAFANEYIAFQSDWSALVTADGSLPTRVFIADQDPTFELRHLPKLERAYPKLHFEVLKDAGLALTFQHYSNLTPMIAAAAKRAANGR